MTAEPVRPAHEVMGEYARDAARFERERDAALAELTTMRGEYESMLGVAQEARAAANAYRTGRTDARLGLAALAAAVREHVRERHDEPTVAHHSQSAEACSECGPLLRIIAAVAP